MDIKEIDALVSLRVANTGYEKLMEIMEALKDDPVFLRGLLDAIRNYPAPTGNTKEKHERVGGALMLAIFHFVEAEVMK